MEDERYQDLEKSVNYLNDEGFAGEGKQFMLFRSADEAIEALRNNQIPGVNWTPEDERKWQEQIHLEQCYNSVEE